MPPHAGSSVILVFRSLRNGETQEQYSNKQKHWKSVVNSSDSQPGAFDLAPTLFGLRCVDSQIL